MSRAVLSVGSNVGDRLGQLRAATRHFDPWLVAASAVYETAPWGPVPQPHYLNAVLLVSDATADGPQWLRRAQAAEAAAGRVRDVRFGPRTLDVDLIAVDDERRSGPDLTLPHPRAAERAFVLVPWLDLEPGAVLPGYGPVDTLLGRLDAAEVLGVRRRDDLLLVTTGREG